VSSREDGDGIPGPPLISRRRLLQAGALGGVASALVRRSSVSWAATPPADWPQVIAAAKKEGKVVVNTFPGDGYKRALKAFTQAYPDIKLEHTGLHSQDFAPRILQERQASLFTWDVATIPTSTALQVLRPAGVWDPVRPAIVLPEVTDDAGWEGGYERGFAVVKDRALAYGFCAVRGSGITINTDLVKDEPKGLTDLLNPKWKGKLLLPDVRTMGDSFWAMTSARLNLGDDIIKKLFVDQEPVLSRDTRQIAEFMVRGRYPIALAVNPLLLGQFQKQGLGKNVKLLHLPEIDVVSFSSTLWLVNRAPHPNAAKLFANWLLTKDGQAHWAREVEQNSRRAGVEPGNPHLLPPKGARLFQVDAEENLPEVIKTQDIAKAVIK
jgi:ABC-type Fe3+ transport system substrate-binding protein